MYHRSNTRSNIQPEILAIVEAEPGVSSRKVLELMPHATHSQIHSMLHFLVKRGDLVFGEKTPVRRDDGNTRTVATYHINPDPAKKPVLSSNRQRKLTEAGVSHQINEMKAKLSELEAWKATALARYPDLAVSPVVLTARKLVADEVRGGGDATLAEQIMHGLKDTILPMRVTIKALEA